ncbi:serine/threonine-protein kinase pelle [Copidosoma floridanum]|uniref:serine/threonine-protein kinase pelle n=1 Tax=Copidosoma floridanum TaxID=29053 RepID=UPI0006C9B04C|nr:serine/threonine-protein kinase pelle [Copidosoma floridanum]
MDRCTFIYELPYSVRADLCNILNYNERWKELAGVYMEYDVSTIQNVRKEKNPTDELLTLWGHFNHTILELFILLSRMQHYQSMDRLKPFVDSKYHVLLYNGEGNLRKIFNKDEKKISTGIPKCHQRQEFHNPHKIMAMDKSKESEKILNNRARGEQLVNSTSNSHNLLASMPEIFSSALPCILYSELATATDYWKKENVLGKGGFGIVFKGIWKNTEVAIKKIEPRSSDYDESYALQLEQSFREIKILNSLPHENILPLYAYSIDGKAPCLVYQCMKNGSLEDRLQMKRGILPLSWSQREEIAKGTARGLQYLHTVHQKPLIHGDIKSANILLDKNFEPKIGDFGLAREGSSDNYLKVSKIQGTRPYLPEEYILERNLSTKIDTYSYGIVLFELATGLPAYDKTRSRNKRLKEYVDSFDEKNMHVLKDEQAGESLTDIFSYIIRLGKWCSNKLAENRPEMTTVYKKLIL